MQQNGKPDNVAEDSEQQNVILRRQYHEEKT